MGDLDIVDRVGREMALHHVGADLESPTDKRGGTSPASWRNWKSSKARSSTFDQKAMGGPSL